MRRHVVAAILAATPLHAESIKTWEFEISAARSYVELHAPTVQGAVATVTFLNDVVHSTDERFELTWHDLTVTFLFDWQYDDTHDERLTVLPPAGYVARPSEIIVPEGGTDVVHIYRWLGQ